MQARFNELYKSLSIMNENNEGLPLISSCTKSDHCWKKALNRSTNYSIYYPWIGAQYKEFKILVIGENMNDYGDINAAYNLIEKAKIDIKQHKRKLFISKTYKGTLLFHRIGCYVASFIKSNDLNTAILKNKYPASINVAESFDYIAYTNHVKCSPKREKSEQTNEMWENCGTHILKDEIRILNPEIILILGTSDNFNNISTKVFDKNIKLSVAGKCKFGEGFLDGKLIKIYVLPHPSSRGGASYEIIKEFYSLINY
jgi:hypothetical protein